MFLKSGLLIAGTVAALGLLYRAFTWFNLKIGLDAGSVSTSNRLIDFLKRLPRTLLSWTFVKKLALDVLLQARLWQKSRLRWAAHICIAYGFMALLLMHALDDYITARLFAGYEATVNPWLALRNIFGLIVILGVIISLRRPFKIGLPVKSKGLDRWALILMILIMVSGFMVEAAKIISSPVFLRMAEDYAGLEQPEELRPLEAYWATHYGVHFDQLEGPFDEDTMAEGAEINEDNCLPCHSRPQVAFASYGLSRIMTPLAGLLNRSRADVWLWYLHVIICLGGLAVLPFTKFLHMVTSPLTLLLERPLKKDRHNPEYLANTRALALDACTHCGLCSEHCSVAPIFQTLGNENILPSEKILGLKSLLRGGRLGAEQQQAIREGNFICTGCYRCTEICPVGLNLQDLWSASQGELAARQLPTPALWAKEDGHTRLAEFERTNGKVIKLNGNSSVLKTLTRSSTFTYCYTCKTCTCSCPVVRHYDEKASEELDLLPHQIIRSIAYGQPDLALNARMLWDCMNCYMCQEHCPQGVRVCDIMYELKNMAYTRLAENSEITGRD
jgi:heterodisulfide reductase subunit C/nitrate reductase gamma subunit